MTNHALICETQNVVEKLGFMAEAHPILPLKGLADRHPGVTRAIADFEIQDNGECTIVTLKWASPSLQT
jgi:hypothetical protein